MLLSEWYLIICLFVSCLHGLLNILGTFTTFTELDRVSVMCSSVEQTFSSDVDAIHDIFSRQEAIDRRQEALTVIEKCVFPLSWFFLWVFSSPTCPQIKNSIDLLAWTCSLFFLNPDIKARAVCQQIINSMVCTLNVIV